MPDSCSLPLAEWFKDVNYDIICLQEVFMKGRIDILTKGLQENGYSVFKPDDNSNTHLLGSGLLTGIKKTKWLIVNQKFISYNKSVGAEYIANKGFHIIEILNKSTNTPLLIINTHMQSDNPTTYFGGCMDTRPIRRDQTQQIYDFLKTYKHIRHLIIGDLNSNLEAHEDIRYLTGMVNGIMKNTFPSTGEDLDHVAIMPHFWLKIIKPIVKYVAVLTKLKWSDHWPISVNLLLGI
jgi:hypothetical protein